MTASRRERLAWLALLLLAALWRLPDLGARAASHDESLHAYYSSRYAELGEYRHDPMMHGPLLFHLGALAFLVAGDSDGVGRLPVALAGIALVAAAWRFRRELGPRGALAAGALLLVSPSIAYYSRYLRNDVYVALFSLLWLRALLDARAGESARPLRRLALWIALACAAKEVAFLVGAIFGALMLAEAVLRRHGAPARRALDLALFQLALVSPFLAGAALWASGAEVTKYDAAGAAWATLAWAVPIAFVALAGAALRLRRTWPAAARELPRSVALCWGILLVLFTSLGTEIAHGIASGVGGSLGYWLEQHGVARGEQPLFYYGYLGLLYEWLPWLLALAAGATLLRSRLARDPAAAEPFPLLVAGWCLASWIGFTIAGERMPWLLTHLALPAILLGAWWLARLLREVTAREIATRFSAGAMLAAAVLLAADLAAHPLAPPAERLRATLLGALLVALGALALGTLRRRGGRSALRAAGATAIAAATLLTARTALLAGFVHDELAIEPLVYAHGTPESGPVLDELERRSTRLGGAEGFDLAIDSDVTWPLAWPLRHWRRQHTFTGEPGEAELAADAIFAGPDRDRELRAPLAFSRQRLAFDLVRWPPETYRSWTPAGAIAASVDPDAWRRGLAFFFYRERLGADLDPWPLRKAAALYLPALALGTGTRSPLPRLAWNEVARVDAAAEAPERPRLGAIDAPGGARYEVDAANHQLRRFAPDGELESESRRETLPLDVPTALAWDPVRGALWVADPGRQRLLAVDRDWRAIAALDVPCWERNDRPGVAVLEDGRVVASVPQGDALLVWSEGSRPAGVVRLEAQAYPEGIELAPDGILRVAVRGAIVELAPGPGDD